MRETQRAREEAPDSPTYSGVPRISLTSVILSMRRDKPKSTIRMSPKGLALVSKMFWGWRWKRLDNLLHTSVTSSGICNIWEKKCLWSRQFFLLQTLKKKSYSQNNNVLQEDGHLHWKEREKVPQFDSEVSKRIYFKIQVHHVVPMQEGHPSQDLLGQPDHIFFCKGLIVICNALVEDFPPSSTVRRDEEIKWEHNTRTTDWRVGHTLSS